MSYLQTPGKAVVIADEREPQVVGGTGPDSSRSAAVAAAAEGRSRLDLRRSPVEPLHAWDPRTGFIELYYLMSTASPYQVHPMHIAVNLA